MIIRRIKKQRHCHRGSIEDLLHAQGLVRNSTELEKEIAKGNKVKLIKEREKKS